MLCDLIDEGIHDRHYIADKVYEVYNHYKSVNSIGSRISDLLNPDNAYNVTKGTIYEGNIAVIDANTKVIRWADKHEIGLQSSDL
jgi:hypothetical protein